MRRLLALTVLALLASACTDHKDAGPSPTTDATTSTTFADYTGVVLPGVGGETTTTIDEMGTARLVGTVTGPRGGPTGGATVRIERLVAGREIRHDVITTADGRWELRGVPGGRYRVRAFLAPSFAQAGAEVRFVNDGQETKFDLKVEDQRGVVVRADVAPDQPLLDSAVNLVVLVVQRTVSPDGIVRSTPVANTFVELTGLGRWVVRDDRPTTTETTLLPGETTSTTSGGGDTSDQGVVLSDTGRARFELKCVRAGAPGLALRIPVLVAAPASSGTASTTTTAPASTTQEVALELPACVDPSTTTTTTTTTPPSSTP